jgi:hypothetical protein
MNYVDRPTLQLKRRKTIFCELENLLKTHSDHEALSDQSSLGAPPRCHPSWQ